MTIAFQFLSIFPVFPIYPACRFLQLLPQTSREISTGLDAVTAAQAQGLLLRVLNLGDGHPGVDTVVTVRALDVVVDMRHVLVCGAGRDRLLAWQILFDHGDGPTVDHSVHLE